MKTKIGFYHLNTKTKSIRHVEKSFPKYLFNTKKKKKKYTHTADCAGYLLLYKLVCVIIFFEVTEYLSPQFAPWQH